MRPRPSDDPVTNTRAIAAPPHSRPAGDLVAPNHGVVDCSERPSAVDLISRRPCMLAPQLRGCAGRRNVISEPASLGKRQRGPRPGHLRRPRSVTEGRAVPASAGARVAAYAPGSCLADAEFAGVGLGPRNGGQQRIQPERRCRLSACFRSPGFDPTKSAGL